MYENITETEWAYFAGLIDGEGTLGVYLRSSRHRGNRQVTPSINYRPRLSVANTDLRMLTWLVERFGGDIKAPPRRLRHKQLYRWRQDGVHRIQAICLSVMPYLVIKKRQAELALAFPADAVCNQWTVDKTTAIREAKKALYAETLQLNHRGVTEVVH